MFVQCVPPGMGTGRILIEGVLGSQIAQALRILDDRNAFDTQLIGLIESEAPHDHAKAIAEQYASSANLHGNWYWPTADLLAFIHHVAQEPIRQLLAQTHPGASDSPLVGIDEMAQILGVSVGTVRRMVKAGEIPIFGRAPNGALKFAPADVIASFRRRSR